MELPFTGDPFNVASLPGLLPNFVGGKVFPTVKVSSPLPKESMQVV